MNIQKTYAFVQPLTNVQNIQARQEAVVNNVLMTPHERQTNIQQLKFQRENLKQSVATALKWDWANVKQEYQTLKREKIGAADRGAKKWDFQRLEYAKSSARDFLKRATPDAIAKRYEQIELSGDNHALRGFVEEGINILNERNFTDRDFTVVLDLKNDFAKMHDSLTVTAEMRDLAKQGEVLTDKIWEVYQATNNADETFKPDINDMYGATQEERIAFQLNASANNPFKDMTKGVQFTHKLDPETLTMTRAVNLDWE